MGVVSPGENRGEIFVLGRRPQTIGCCCCCDTGEFCTDLTFIPPLAGVDAGVVDPLPTWPLPIAPMATAPPPLVLAASPDSDGEAAMLGTFSFDARSMAELRRIMMVLVCGNINRCSLMFCWLCWFRLSRVSVDEDEDDDGDSSGCRCTWFQLSLTAQPEL